MRPGTKRFLEICRKLEIPVEPTTPLEEGIAIVLTRVLDDMEKIKATLLMGNKP